MLDLNVDADVEVDFATDSVGSTTTTSLAAGDEPDCDSRMFTLNFSILSGKEVIHIDDDVGDDSLNEELQLFPMGSSSQSITSQYWLNLSAAPPSGGVELGIYKTHLGMGSSNQVQQHPQIKKSRRGPRSRSSQYRGVTFYRRTGRWESHIWDCGKQVYLGGFDTAHAAARAYDRAAIMFRGVDADINFNISDYEEDMNQMKNFTKEEFVHLLRRQSTSLPRGNSKYRGSPSLPKCSNQWQLHEKRAYEKATIQHSVTGFEANNYASDLNFRRIDGGSGSNLDLNLGISISDSVQVPSLSMQVEAKHHHHHHSAPWGATFPGFSPNNKGEGKVSFDAGTQIWPWKMQSEGVVPVANVPILQSAAASSGFAPAFSSRLRPSPFHNVP